MRPERRGLRLRGRRHVHALRWEGGRRFHFPEPTQAGAQVGTVGRRGRPTGVAEGLSLMDPAVIHVNERNGGLAGREEVAGRRLRCHHPPLRVHDVRAHPLGLVAPPAQYPLVRRRPLHETLRPPDLLLHAPHAYDDVGTGAGGSPAQCAPGAHVRCHRRP